MMGELSVDMRSRLFSRLFFLLSCLLLPLTAIEAAPRGELSGRGNCNGVAHAYGHRNAPGKGHAYGRGNGACRSADAVAPTATLSPEAELGIRQPLQVQFDESIDPASLILEGDLVEVGVELIWSTREAENDTLTVKPETSWESGRQKLTLSVADLAGNVMAPQTETLSIKLLFSNFQAASLVIGQPDFTSAFVGSPNSGAATIGLVYGNAVHDRERDVLFVPDMQGHRVLGFYGIPTSNGANADFVLGADDFHGSMPAAPESQMRVPRAMQVADGKLILSEYHARVSIYEPVPESGPGVIATVIGQENKTARVTGCSANRLTHPLGRWLTPDGKLLVSDRDNHRVLIWNTMPTTDGAAADLVIGQPDFDHCKRNADTAVSARTLAVPRGIWSDGNKVVVADNANRRILIWNSFPTENFAPADIVLGQETLEQSVWNPVNERSVQAFTLTLWSNGEQLILSDGQANRVLIWNEFPTFNNEPADVVLGQSDFLRRTPNDDNQDGISDGAPSARTFAIPASLSVSGDKLFISDFRNARVLVFESE